MQLMKPLRPRVCGPPLSFTILTAPSKWRFAMATSLTANLSSQYLSHVSHVQARGLTSSYTNMTALATVASSKDVLAEMASRSDCKQSSLYCKESCVKCCCCCCCQSCPDRWRHAVRNMELRRPALASASGTNPSVMWLR
jgi:hypothetical protein